MKNVAVIGAGTMGNGIAHTFAQSDYRVQLIDISEESLKRGMATIAKNLDRMVAKGSITETDKEKTLANITTYTNLERSEERRVGKECRARWSPNDEEKKTRITRSSGD